MFKRIAMGILVPLALAGAALLAGVAPAAAALVSAVEFHHGGFDHYFITTSTTEIALLDAGTITGWSRTGQEFLVDDAPGPGLVPVCRFFSASFAPKSSHFYTPFADECAKVKANADWTFEAEAFYVRVPDAAGNCADGTGAVYRLYNNGQGGAPNHSYTPYRSSRGQYIKLGWIPEGLGSEGVIFCVPAYFDLAPTRTQQLNGGTWEFNFTIGKAYAARVVFGPAEATGDPEAPFTATVTNPFGSGAAAWDSFAGKIVAVLVVDLELFIFIFDFDGGNAVQGCVFDTAEILTAGLGGCHPFTARRL